MKRRHKSALDFTLKSDKKKKSRIPSKFRTGYNIFFIVLAALVLGYGFIAFVGQSVYMMGPSMESTINDGEELILSKRYYNFHEIERYDIVAIKKIDSDEYYDIKRVVGLPGDTIAVVGGRLVINGKQTEDGFSFSYITSPGRLDSGVTLDSDEYFVIGDNPVNSEDSRYINYGNVVDAEIAGKIIYRIQPKKRRGKVY